MIREGKGFPLSRARRGVGGWLSTHERALYHALIVLVYLLALAMIVRSLVGGGR